MQLDHVEAGPGTRKTAVALRARSSHLINEEDIEASNAWMISFTRTAWWRKSVRELHSNVGDASFAIRIATVELACVVHPLRARPTRMRGPDRDLCEEHYPRHRAVEV